MTHVLHLDSETYSEVDLKKCGAYKNLGHKSSEIMLAQYALDNDPVTLMDFTELHGGRYLQRAPKGSKLMDYLTDPEIIIEAFNATFERLALKLIWGIDIPASRFHCTMVRSWSLGFTGGLGDVGEELGLNPDKKKLATGKALIRRFCMPTPRNYKLRRYTRHTHPEEWERFKEYGIQDVVAEREISMLLAPYPMLDRTQEMYCLDQRINDHGVLVDLDAVNGALTIDAEEKHELKLSMQQLTGLDNPNSGPQLLGWLKEKDYPLGNLQKATVSEAVEDLDKSNDGMSEVTVLDVLKLKQKISKTSISKYKAFKNARRDDNGRFCGALQFMAAGRTGRWGGRLVQLQNLPQPKIDRPEDKAWILSLADRDMVHDLHGDVSTFLSSCIRCMIVAPKGKKLVVSDFASVESRIVAWLSGCERMNKLFADGKDSYKDFATELFDVTYDEVTPAQRKYSKAPTLAGAYGMGAGNKKTGEGGLIAYAAGMKHEMTYDEAKHAIDTYRGMYPEIPKLWNWLTDACIDVVQNYTVREGYAVRITRDNNFLQIQLPSGRKLSYFKPLVQLLIPPWEKDKEPELVKVQNILTGEWEEKWLVPPPKRKATLTYMGKNSFSNKWERMSTHGGKTTENICQAIGADLLTEAQLALSEESSHPIILSVHDELVMEVPETEADSHLVYMNAVLSRPINWCLGLLLSAAGFVTNRYSKD